MKILHRLIFCLAFAIFATDGAAMLVSPGAEMQQVMAETMSDCDDCAGDSGGRMTGCELVCASPIFGVVNSGNTAPRFLYSARLELPDAELSAGFRYPPDPFPPKYLI